MTDKPTFVPVDKPTFVPVGDGKPVFVPKEKPTDTRSPFWKTVMQGVQEAQASQPPKLVEAVKTPIQEAFDETKAIKLPSIGTKILTGVAGMGNNQFVNKALEDVEQKKQDAILKFQLSVMTTPKEERQQIIDNSDIDDDWKDVLSFASKQTDYVSPEELQAAYDDPASVQRDFAENAAAVKLETENKGVYPILGYFLKLRYEPIKALDEFPELYEKLYNNFIGAGVPYRDKKELIQHAIGAEENFSGKLTRTGLRLPVFIAEMAATKRLLPDMGIAELRNIGKANKLWSTLVGSVVEGGQVAASQAVFSGQTSPKDVKANMRMGVSFNIANSAATNVGNLVFGKMLTNNNLPTRLANAVIRTMLSSTAGTATSVGLSGDYSEENWLKEGIVMTGLALLANGRISRAAFAEQLVQRGIEKGEWTREEAEQVREALIKSTTPEQLAEWMKTIKDEMKKVDINKASLADPQNTATPIKKIADVVESVKIGEEAQKKSEEIVKGEQKEKTGGEDVAGETSRIRAKNIEDITESIRNAEQNFQRDFDTKTPEMMSKAIDALELDMASNKEVFDTVRRLADRGDKNAKDFLDRVNKKDGAGQKEAQPQGFPVSIKNSFTDAELERLGMPAFDKTIDGSRQRAMDEAKAKMESDPNAINDLKNKIEADDKYAPSDVENMMLTREFVASKLEIAKLGKEFQETGSQLVYEALKNKSMQMAKDIEIYHKAGTASSHSLSSRKAMVNMDYSLAKMMADRIIAKGGQLSKSETESVTKLSKEIEDLKSKLDSVEKERDEAKREFAFSQQMKEFQRGAEKKAKTIKREERIKTIRAERSEILKEVLKTYSANVGINYDIKPLGKLIKSHIEEISLRGKWKIEDVYDAVREELKGYGVHVSNDDLRKAYQDNLGDTAKEYVKKEEGKFSPYQINKLARNLVESGVTDAKDLVQKTHEILSKIDPKITEREAQDLISGYGSFKGLSKDDVSVELRDYKGQLQQLSKIEDMKSGMAPLKTGIERRSPSDIERQLIKEVNELKKIGGYRVFDKDRQLKSAMDAIMTRYKNMIADLKYERESGKRIIKEKTELKLTEEAEKIRDEYRKIKEEVNAAFGYDIDLARAKKGVKTQINKFLSEDVGKKPIGDKFVSDAELNSLRNELLDIKKDYVANTKKIKIDAPDKIKISSAITRYEKLITKLETERDSGQRIAKEVREKHVTTGEQLLKNEYENLRKEVDAIFGFDGLLNRRKKYVAKQIEKYDKIIADVKSGVLPEKKEPQNYKKDADVVNLEYEMAKKRAEADRAVFDLLLEKRGFGKKSFDSLVNLLDLTRASMTGLDLSAPFRQGKFMIFSNPIISAKAVPTMVKSFFSEKEAHAANMRILHDEYYGRAIRAKLFLSEHGHNLTNFEEAVRSKWGDRVPIIAGSNRAYTTYLNQVRYNAFKAGIKSMERMGSKGQLSKQEDMVVANLINVASGRGSSTVLGKDLNAAMNAASSIFFAPRYVLSRFQLALGQPLQKAIASEGFVSRAALFTAKEYSKYVVGAASLIAISKMYMDDKGDKLEDDPRSSQFLKVKIGKNSWLDMYGGLQQTAVLMSRLATGEIKEGDIIRSLNEKVPITKSDWGDVGSRFLRYKLAPVPRVVIDVASGKDALGNNVNTMIRNFEIPQVGNVYKMGRNNGLSDGAAMKFATGAYILKELALPMNIDTIWDAFKQEGMSDAVIISVLSTLGEGIQTYEKRVK